MESESPSPYPQVPATCPYPEPAPSSLHDPTNFLKNHLNIILPSTSWSPQWPLSLRLPTNTLYTPLSSPIRATHPAHLIRLDFTTRTMLGKEYRSFSSSLCSFLHSPVTSSLLDPNTLLNTLFSNTLSLRSSLSVSDQVSHPYKTTGKIIVLYILTFKFLDDLDLYRKKLRLLSYWKCWCMEFWYHVGIPEFLAIIHAIFTAVFVYLIICNIHLRECIVLWPNRIKLMKR